MPTFVHLDGTRILGAFVQDTDEGLPEPWAEAPPRDEWPARPSSVHEPQLLDGVVSWVDPRTPEQLATDARATRDALLAESDWMVTRGIELGTGVPAPWGSYRQALRDITGQPGFPAAIDWPTPPTV